MCVANKISEEFFQVYKHTAGKFPLSFKLTREVWMYAQGSFRKRFVLFYDTEGVPNNRKRF